MAAPTIEEECGLADSITRSDLCAELVFCFTKWEATMTEKLIALIAPLSAQLQEMQQNMNQLAQTTDAVMDWA